METTREQVLRLVRQRREATVAQVATAMGVSQAAVRRHLDGLRADGLIDVRFERHGVGRPALLFSATERGEEVVGRGYLHLVSRLFRRLDQMAPEQVGGQSGRGVLQTAFEGVAHEIAADHRTEVLGMTLGQRVEEASRALKSEGIVDAWEKVGDTYHLLNSDCPYLRLAEISDAPCCSDRLSIELLLGAPVEQTKRIAAGESCCEYIVREPLTPDKRTT